MSTVKISQLPAISPLNANTSHTILIAVDTDTGSTGKITVQGLSDNLYTDNDLNVGTKIVYPDGSEQTTSPIASSTYANGAFVQANAAYTQANTAATRVDSAETYANGSFRQANAGFTQANTAISNAAGASLYANAAFITANTPTHVANSAALYANGSFRQANAAFAVANNALANTTGTFGGSLYISENLSVNGTLTLSNSNFNSTESAVLISATTNVATPAADGYMIHISGKNGVPSKIVSDSYGTGSYSVYASRTARGNVTHPAAVQTGDIIGRFSGGGYGTTKFQTLGTSRIDFVASENYTDANTGSQITFWNCPIGSNTLTNIATFNGTSAVFTGVVSPQKGFIFTPRLPVGDQTAITVDYSADSMIKANLVADLTVSHTNFTSGKVVEMWLTNNSGSNKTVTHGVASLRSTNKSTTFTIASQSSAYLKFFSVDGDIANTFVSIIG